MAEHLTLVSLRRAVSSRAGVSEKVADDFLAALFGSIQDGLKTSGQVTINGLGTFKLQDVPARESVNVATGERITINGYKKIVFSAEKARTGKTLEAPTDPIQKLGEQAEEIKDILSELNAMGAEVRNGTDHTDLTDAGETVVSTKAAEPTEKKKESKPFNAWLTGLITVAVFAILLVVAYFVLRHQIINWADGMRTTIEQRVNTPDVQNGRDLTDAKETGVSTESLEPTVVKVQVSTEATEQTESTNSDHSVNSELKRSQPDYYDDNKRKFTEFQAPEIVGKDSRLSWIAYKRYGEKALWVFIYEANRDRLQSPDRVLPGIELRIPKLPKELLDVNNPETKALLERLSDKYLN